MILQARKLKSTPTPSEGQYRGRVSEGEQQCAAPVQRARMHLELLLLGVRVGC